MQFAYMTVVNYNDHQTITFLSIYMYHQTIILYIYIIYKIIYKYIYICDNYCLTTIAHDEHHLSKSCMYVYVRMCVRVCVFYDKMLIYVTSQKN